MQRVIFLLIILSLVQAQVKAQGGVVLTFKATAEQGISLKELDSLYKSAVHTDTTLAVFKSEEGQEKVRKEYARLLNELGIFLADNNFKWERPTRCFNRIYFHTDGTIDYFIYNFPGEEETQPPKEMQDEFHRILTGFVKAYRTELEAEVKFSQCSPVTYHPE